MIDSKQHALEILQYIMMGRSEADLRALVDLSVVQHRKGSAKIDEDIFWECVILGSEEGLAFVGKRKISILDEVILAHQECKMKYHWGTYKKISCSIDIFYDDLDSSNFLD